MTQLNQIINQQLTQVLHALLGRVPPSETASLFGYHRYRIKDHVYPAIRPKEGSSVKGLFMPGLDAREKVQYTNFVENKGTPC